MIQKIFQQCSYIKDYNNLCVTDAHRYKHSVINLHPSPFASWCHTLFMATSSLNNYNLVLKTTELNVIKNWSYYHSMIREVSTDGKCNLGVGGDKYI